MTQKYVTSAGLKIPTIEELQADIFVDQQSLVDPNIDTSPESPIGNLNGIFANHLREAYEVVEIAYNGFNRDAAEGFLLGAIGALTGTKANPATPSFFKGTNKVKINLNAGTPVPIGTVFSQNGSPLVRFKTIEQINNPNPVAGDFFVACECTVNGPTPCAAGTLTVIVTPVSGLNSVTNPGDAFLGKLADTDAQYRVRQESELRATGSATVLAIRSDILAIEINNVQPVVDCIVRENTSDGFDSQGLPPHSFEALVFDGLGADVPNDTIAQTIWESKGAGVRSVGNTSGIAIDSEGNHQTERFSRPTQVEVTIAQSLVVDTTKYIGHAAVKAAIVEAFPKYASTPGQPIRFADFIAVVMGLGGVIDAPSIQLGFFGGAPLAPFVNLSMGTRQVAWIQTTDVTLTVVDKLGNPVP